MTSGDAVGYQPFPSFARWAPEFDSSTVDRFTDLLDTARSESTLESVNRAVRITTRYAAVDTGAIEGLYTVDRGFTRTIAEETATWETALDARGEPVRRSIDDALRGYEFVMDAVTGSQPITESWIRQLHETLCNSQDTYTVYTAVGEQRQDLPKGVYKSMPNSPTGRVHHYAPVLDTPAEMSRLIEQLRSAEFMATHPVLQAAYAHYAFVCIHPFADGNGRVSRALASVFLYRSPGVPLVVFADQKDDYLDSLESADSGRPESFVSFIERRTIDTIELVRLHLGEAPVPPGDRSIAALARNLTGSEGLTHAEYDAFAHKLLGRLEAEVMEQLSKLKLPNGVAWRIQRLEDRDVKPPNGYRLLGGRAAGVRIRLDAKPPADVSVARSMWVFPAQFDRSISEFLVLGQMAGRSLEIHLRDVRPVETHVLGLKIEAWVQREVDDALDRLSQDVRAKLVDRGYASGDPGPR